MGLQDEGVVDFQVREKIRQNPSKGGGKEGRRREAGGILCVTDIGVSSEHGSTPLDVDKKFPIEGRERRKYEERSKDDFAPRSSPPAKLLDSGGREKARTLRTH